MRLHVLTWVNTKASQQRLIGASDAAATTNQAADDASVASSFVSREKAFQSLWPPLRNYLTFAVLLKRLTCKLPAGLHVISK